MIPSFYNNKGIKKRTLMTKLWHDCLLYRAATGYYGIFYMEDYFYCIKVQQHWFPQQVFNLSFHIIVLTFWKSREFMLRKFDKKQLWFLVIKFSHCSSRVKRNFHPLCTIHCLCFLPQIIFPKRSKFWKLCIKMSSDKCIIYWSSILRLFSSTITNILKKPNQNKYFKILFPILLSLLTGKVFPGFVISSLCRPISTHNHIFRKMKIRVSQKSLEVHVKTICWRHYS